MIIPRVSRVAYVGDSSQIALALSQMLREAAEWEVVDLSRKAPLSGIAATLPDVAVVDLRTTSPLVWACLSYMRVIVPTTQVVALVATHDPSLLLAAVQAGALGWLKPQQVVTDLPAILHRARERRGILNPALARLILHHYAALFLPHEQTILTTFAQGHSFTMVATTLEIEAPYLERHIGNILLKLMATPDADALAAVAEERAIAVGCSESELLPSRHTPRNT